MSRKRCVPFVALALFGLALTGCASHAAGPPASASAGNAFPATITPSGAPSVTIPAQPKRIVSLDASNTETLYAIGAGSQVVAVDKDSNYPAAVPHTSLDATKPNIEAIAAYHPDLVVTAYDTNSLVSGLKAVHVPVLLLPAPTTVAQAYTDWTELGTATGHRARADSVVAAAKQTITRTVAKAPKRNTPGSYYYELDQTYYTATSHTFIGSLIGLFGLSNIADPADTAASGGYPQLSAEQILKADPTLIFLADHKCCGQDATAVAARPGWSTLAAVRDGNVVALDDDIASRWGPRITDLVQAVGTAVAKADHVRG
jgi:iron complex transport system substrate-binding protein